MSRDSVIDRFRENAAKLGAQPALHMNESGSWSMISWKSYWEQCKRFAGALLSLGYEPGQAVTIMGNNCAQWVIADAGAIMARAVPAGVYQTSTPEQVEYIVSHCEARVFVIEDEAMWENVVPVADKLEKVEKFVMIRDADKISHEKVLSFDDFLALGADHLDEVDACIDAIEMDDLATLIYTSGTTGKPKGVMLSHENLAFTSKNAGDAVGGLNSDDVLVSYLPLSHIAEQMFTIHAPLTYGMTIWFCDDLTKLKDTLVAARPTIFFGVPRVWEKFKAALEVKLGEATGLKSKIVSWARGVGQEAGYAKLTRGTPFGFSANLANKLFQSKLRAGLGLDRMRIAMVAAAPIGVDVLEFFLSCGIAIHEIYGQSEGSGPTTVNRPKPGETKLGTVGLPFPGSEVKIAEDGEILLKGGNVFMGYYKNEKATESTLIDGWMYSGDIGKFDEDGFLRITDRKKDLIITAGGKNVAPQKSEKLLRKIDGISQAVVIGDRRKFLTALLTLDPDRAPALAGERGWPTDLEKLAKHADFVAHVQQGVNQANAELARYETIKRFELLPTDFTVEGGELTPTQKIKRRVVNEKYSDAIEALYQG